jgi:nitroimidazol reductase NimA-like FMN-containing flavoprotein (pyridoxamine 5'-phosphate oxidase superfamily)
MTQGVMNVPADFGSAARSLLTFHYSLFTDQQKESEQSFVISGENMTTAKRPAKRQQAVEKAGPIADRPLIPSDYGVLKGKKGMLPWSHVIERMTAAMHYWVSTVDPNGHPHATPVDGLWLDDRFYFGGSPQTRRHRNLAANPAICIHLESASDVVILHGEAHELRAPDRSLTIRLSEASNQKYGYGMTPEQYETMGGILVFRPRLALAWKDGLKDATRWRFPNDERSE